MTDEQDMIDNRPEIGNLLPCFKCGKEITESVPCGGTGMDINGNTGDWKVPYKGTEFTTHGHYGSTFWDSFDGEFITITICDDCCKQHIKFMRFRQILGNGKTKEFFPEYFKDLADQQNDDVSKDAGNDK